MQAAIAGKERETLLKEISNAFLQWSELERDVFFQAHYRGISIEAISLSARIDAEEVAAILRRCERRLHSSLRGFRRSIREEGSVVPPNTLLFCRI